MRTWGGGQDKRIFFKESKAWNLRGDFTLVLRPLFFTVLSCDCRLMPHTADLDVLKQRRAPLPERAAPAPGVWGAQAQLQGPNEENVA